MTAIRYVCVCVFFVLLFCAESVWENEWNNLIRLIFFCCCSVTAPSQVSSQSVKKRPEIHGILNHNTLTPQQNSHKPTYVRNRAMIMMTFHCLPAHNTKESESTTTKSKTNNITAINLIFFFVRHSFRFACVCLPIRCVCGTYQHTCLFAFGNNKRICAF